MTAPLPLAASDKIISALSSQALATVLYFPIPGPGRIKDFQVAIGAALGTADETFTLAYAPPGSVTYTSCTGCAPVMTSAASAAGNVARAQPAPSASCYVTDGGTLRITPSGGGSAAVPLGITIVIGN